MGYYDELNANPNPDTNMGAPAPQTPMPPQGDPMVQAGADMGVVSPAAPYGGLTGAPLETMMVTSAQLQALAPPKRRIPRRTPNPAPFAGLSSYLGA